MIAGYRKAELKDHLDHQDHQDHLDANSDTIRHAPDMRHRRRTCEISCADGTTKVKTLQP